MVIAQIARVAEVQRAGDSILTVYSAAHAIFEDIKKVTGDDVVWPVVLT
jgi:hypothetical protein